MRKTVSILLALCLLLSALPLCAAEEEFTRYADMEYERPDLQELQDTLDKVITLSKTNKPTAILDAMFDFYDAYDWFYTCSSLADIHYSANLKDKFWEAENDYCTSASSQVGQMLDDLNRALAASPARDRLEAKFFGQGFFEAYDGESSWDDTLLDLLAEESALISRYYSQSASSDNLLTALIYGNDRMAQTLVDLITVRQQIAAYCGYDSYPEYANEAYYYRDYDQADMDAYLLEIQEKLVPLYREYWSLSADLPETHESESMAFVQQVARKIGGVVWDAFQLMWDAGLYDIGYSKNKYDSSFEVFLYSYGEPFLFLCPTRTAYDHLNLAHEFGHFCNDYACGGSESGIDVNEIFSQSMEYLVLCYGEDTEELAVTKLADSLCTYVEQACYARFEQEMYRLENPTVQALYDLYEEIGTAYGFDSYDFDPTDFVAIPHFYTDPMYVSSYIISNDAAMQIYQMELEHPGQGRDHLLNNLDTQESYFLAFLEEAGLESPFTPGRLDTVADTFQKAFAA